MDKELEELKKRIENLELEAKDTADMLILTGKQVVGINETLIKLKTWLTNENNLKTR